MRPEQNIGGDLIRKAKWAFTTRRVTRSDIATVRQELSDARPGDLVLGRVTRIGSHKRIQLPCGRPSQLYPGDLVVMTCGARYATDQFEGVAEIPRQGAQMLAGGGVLGRMRAQNGRMSNPTQVLPLGLLANRRDRICNTADYVLPGLPEQTDIVTIGVIGAAMNAGKTTSVAGLVHGLKRSGYRVAAIKATGTGAFGDYNAYWDAGADFVADFLDAGMVSTYLEPLPRIIDGTGRLLAHAKAQGCDVAIVELADGILQRETAALLGDAKFRSWFGGWVYAASDAMSALGCMPALAGLGLSPAVLTGKLTASPLAVEEVRAHTDTPVATLDDLMDPALAAALLNRISNSARHSRTPQGIAAA